MALRPEEVAKIEADSAWWQELAADLGLGTLAGFTYRASASFYSVEKNAFGQSRYYSVEGPMVGVLTKLRDELTKLRKDS